MNKSNFNEFNLTDLTISEAKGTNGGGFAYDFGFFLRELGVYIVNGANIGGGLAVVADVAANYKPIN
jgi:hypothetical protein